MNNQTENSKEFELFLEKCSRDSLVMELIDAMTLMREISKTSKEVKIRSYAKWAEGKIQSVADRISEKGIRGKEYLEKYNSN